MLLVEFCLVQFEDLNVKFSESVRLLILIITSLFGHGLIQESENCLQFIIKGTLRSTPMEEVHRARCGGWGAMRSSSALSRPASLLVPVFTKP